MKFNLNQIGEALLQTSEFYARIDLRANTIFYLRALYRVARKESNPEHTPEHMTNCIITVITSLICNVLGTISKGTDDLVINNGHDSDVLTTSRRRFVER